MTYTSPAVIRVGHRSTARAVPEIPEDDPVTSPIPTAPPVDPLPPAELPTVRAIAYPPCRRRSLYLLIVACPDPACPGGWHVHRARRVDPGERIVRTAPCGFGPYRITVTPPIRRPGAAS